MARLPRNPEEAVESLGIAEGSSVLAVGPDHGFVEAFAEAIGSKGKLTIQAPPPDLQAPDGVDVIDELGADTKAETVIGWAGVVPVHGARDLGAHVADNGSLWIVLPKVARDARAPVTEGDVKKAMLSAGWREERVVPLSNDSFAVRFRRRG